MTIIVLTKLYEMQDRTIEHKLPNYNGNISYFIEAAGDIYRELCHDPADIGGYIAEKRMKLLKFYELDEVEIEEIKNMSKEHPDWYENLDDYIFKVDELSAETEKSDFHIYTVGEVLNSKGRTGVFYDRKERMLSALDIIQAICFYAKGDLSKEGVENIIKENDELYNKK